MTVDATLQHLTRLFDESCLEVFAEFDCDIRKTEEVMPVKSDDPLAMIDAGSRELEIALVLRLPVNILALTYPAGADIAHVSEETLEDWIAEISNQLIGKIKNKLLGYNVRISLGLPNAYFGVDLDELIATDRHCFVSVFDIDNELLEVIILVDIHDPSIDLSAPPQADDGPGGGELELF